MSPIVRLIGCALVSCALVFAAAVISVHAEEAGESRHGFTPRRHHPFAADAAPSVRSRKRAEPERARPKPTSTRAQRFRRLPHLRGQTRTRPRALFTVAPPVERKALAEQIFDPARSRPSSTSGPCSCAQTRGGSDDLFFYVDRTGSSYLDRKCAPAAPLVAGWRRHAFFGMLRDRRLSPDGAPAELSYAAGADELSGGRPRCRVVIGTTPSPYLGFDRVEAGGSRKSSGPAARKSATTNREKVARQLTSKPRGLPGSGWPAGSPSSASRATWPDEGLHRGSRLVNMLPTPGPARQTCSAPLNLRKQHFPEF